MYTMVIVLRRLFRTALTELLSVKIVLSARQNWAVHDKINGGTPSATSTLCALIF